MYYNVNEIKQFLSFFNPEHFTEDDVDNFIDEVSMQSNVPEFSWEAGATKCVIIPAERDYVVKIPFDGCYYCYSDDNEFILFCNGGGENGWDYCQLEDEYWVEIIEGSGFENFFLCTEWIDVSEWPIYVQPKVVPCNENTKAHSSIESIYKVRTDSKERISLPDEWLATCLENLGNDIKKLDEFICFLKENFKDLHEGNIGYRGDQAVILDYAGFED